MGAIADFWKSERGLLAVLLVIGATILTALGQMSIAEWREYTLWIFGLYAGLKTVTSTAELITGKATPPTLPPVSAPSPPEPEPKA